MAVSNPDAITTAMLLKGEADLTAIMAALEQVQGAVQRVIQNNNILLSSSIQMAGGMEAASGSGSILGDVLERVSVLAGAAGQGLSLLSGFMGGFLVKAIETAGRTETLYIALDQMGKNAGYTKERLRELVKQLTETGITTQQSVQGLMRMMQLELDVTKAFELAQVAKNAAVIQQTNTSEAFGRIIYAIMTRQPMLLESLGLAFTRTELQARGMFKATSSIAEKQAAMMDMIIEKGKNLEGVYDVAMATFLKNLGSSKRYIEEMLNAIGAPFLGAMAKLIEFINNSFKAFNKLNPKIQEFTAYIVAAIAAFGGGLPALAGALGQIFGLLQGATGFSGFGFLAGVLRMIAPYIPAIAAAATALYFALNELKKAWDANAGGIQEKVKPAIDLLISVFNRLQEIIGYHINELMPLLQANWERLKELATSLWNSINKFLKDHSTLAQVVGEIWSFISVAIDTALYIIDQAFYTLENILRGDWRSAFSNVSNAGEAMLGLLGNTLLNFIPKMLNYGAEMMRAFIAGFLEYASTWLPSALNSIGQTIAMFLEGHSPPKYGPLTEIDTWGGNVGSAFVRGFSATTAMGANIVDQFAAGMEYQTKKSIPRAIRVINKQLRDMLEGHSPPPAIPDIPLWGKNAFEQFLAGFSMADFSVFNSALGLIRTRLQNVFTDAGMDAKAAAQKILSAMMEIREGVAGFISGGGAAVIDKVAGVPIADIMHVVNSQLEASRAAENLSKMQEAFQTMQKQSQKAIKEAQKAVSNAQEDIERFNRGIEEAVKERLKVLGIVLDSAKLKLLQMAVRDAEEEVQAATAQYNKARAARERYGLTIASYEEINARAQMALAQEKKDQATIELNEEEKRWRLAERIQTEIAKSREEELKRLQDNLKNAQKNLKSLQESYQEQIEAEQERLANAQQHVKDLQKVAEREKALLAERLKAEEEQAKIKEEQVKEEKKMPAVPPTLAPMSYDVYRKSREHKKREAVEAPDIITQSASQIREYFEKTIIPALIPVRDFIVNLGTEIWKFVGPDLTSAWNEVTKFWDEVMVRFAKVRDAFERSAGIKKIIKDLSQAWEDIKKIGGAVLSFLVPIWKFLLTAALPTFIKGIWTAVKGYVEIAWSVLTGYLKIFLDILAGDWKAVKQDFLDMVNGVLSGVKNVLKGFDDAFGSPFQFIFDRARSIVRSAVTEISWMFASNFAAVNNSIDRFVRSIGEAIGNLARSLVSPLNVVGDAIFNAFSWAFSRVIGSISGWISSIGLALGSQATGIYNAAAGLVSNIYNAFRNWIGSLAGWVPAWLGSVVNSISSMSSNFLSASYSVANNIYNAFYNAIRWIVDAIGGWIKGIWNNAMKPAFEGVVNRIVDSFNAIIDRLNSAYWSLPDYVRGAIPGFPLGKLGRITLPGLALGAIVNVPTVALVGESGPEAVVPLDILDRWVNKLANQSKGILNINIENKSAAPIETKVSMFGDLSYWGAHT